MKSTLDSVFKIILGVDLDTIYGTYEEGTEFSNAFDEASAITLYRYVDVFWKIKRFLNIGSEAVLGNLIKVVDNFVYKLIRIKIEQVQKSQYDFPVSKIFTPTSCYIRVNSISIHNAKALYAGIQS